VDIGGTAYHALIRGNFHSRLFKKELERYLERVKKFVLREKGAGTFSWGTHGCTWDDLPRSEPWKK